MRRTLRQAGLLLLVVALFAAFNGSIYMLLTRRLTNHYSGVDQAKMIDVGAYLPHDPHSALARVESSLTFTAQDDLPVLDGAAALFPVYAAVADALYPVGSVTYEGGVFSDDNYYGENFAPDSRVQYRNTVRGYTAVVDGDADIFFSAAPSEAQRQYAAEQGVELICVPIGREAFVFFVNQRNPVDDLTVGQIRDIYAGEITDWAQVGGAHRVINPVTRLEGSGSQSMMEAFMGEREITRKSPLALVGGSIGFSFRYYMEGMVDSDSVKMLKVNGVAPTAENIRNGAYPIVTEFYAIYRADNDNENIPKLIGWLLSPEGQRLIEESGYVSIS